MCAALEKQGAEAALKCKQLVQEQKARQLAVQGAQAALQQQRHLVETFKQDYACASHLAVNFADEQLRSEVHVRAANVLAPFYPDTPLFSREATELQAGFFKGVTEAASASAICQVEIEAAVTRLQEAQAKLPKLQQALEEAEDALSGVQAQAQRAQAEYKLLKQERQWARHKW